MKVKALNDKVVVRRKDADEKTPGGILIPDASKDKPREGTILDVGEGKLLDNGQRAPFSPAIKPGAKVIFSNYAGSEIKVNDEELMILAADDLLAVIEE